MRPLPKDFWISIAVAIVLSFLFAAWAIPEADRHGGRGIATLLFPYSMLALLLHTDYQIVIPLLAWVQYPVYVTLLSLARNRSRMLTRLIVLHAIFLTGSCLIAYQNV